MSRSPVATPPIGAPQQPGTARKDKPRELAVDRVELIAACKRARADDRIRDSIAQELIVGLQAIAEQPEATERENLERALLRLVGRIVKGMVTATDATSSTLALSPPTGAQWLDPALREDALRLLRELEAMPEELRRPVTLHHLAGLEFCAVATALRTTETEAKLRVHLGVMSLRQRLGTEKRLIDLLPQLKYLRDTSGAQRIIGGAIIASRVDRGMPGDPT